MESRLVRHFPCYGGMLYLNRQQAPNIFFGWYTLNTFLAHGTGEGESSCLSWTGCSRTFMEEHCDGISFPKHRQDSACFEHFSFPGGFVSQVVMFLDMFEWKMSFSKHFFLRRSNAWLEPKSHAMDLSIQVNIHVEVINNQPNPRQ